MPTINKIEIIGHLGDDPKMTSNDASRQAIVRLSVATSDKWKDKITGEKKEKTQWHNVVCFGKLSEIVMSYFNKGDLVYVAGRMNYTKYEDKDGTERRGFQIIANEAFVFNKKGGESNFNNSNPKANAPNEYYQAKNEPGNHNDYYSVMAERKEIKGQLNKDYEFNDDIPF